MAYRLWERVERERVRLGMTRLALSRKSATSRSTIAGLKASTRAPQPRIVHALADAVGLDRREAEVLAGLVDPPRDGSVVAVREAIGRVAGFTAGQRALLLGMVDVIEQANGAVG